MKMLYFVNAEGKAFDGPPPPVVVSEMVRVPCGAVVVIEDDAPYILASSGQHRYQLINLKNGNRWSDNIIVASFVTLKDLYTVIGEGFQVYQDLEDYLKAVKS